MSATSTTRKNNYQFILFKIANQLKELGYTIKMCNSAEKGSATAVFILSRDKHEPTYYISAEDFEKGSKKPMYRIGFVEVDNSGDCLCHEYYCIDDITKHSIDYYIDLIKSEITIASKDNLIIQSLMRNDLMYIEWIKSYNFKPFIRKYEINDKVINTTNF